MCNRELIAVKGSDLKREVPKGVLRRHRLFYECEGCFKVYWKGRQWSRLRRLSSMMRP